MTRNNIVNTPSIPVPRISVSGRFPCEEYNSTREQEYRRTGERENRRTGEQENRRTGEQENRRRNGWCGAKKGLVRLEHRLKYRLEHNS